MKEVVYSIRLRLNQYDSWQDFHFYKGSEYHDFKSKVERFFPDMQYLMTLEINGQLVLWSDNLANGVAPPKLKASA